MYYNIPTVCHTADYPLGVGYVYIHPDRHLSLPCRLVSLEFAKFRIAKDKAQDKRFSNIYASTTRHFPVTEGYCIMDDVANLRIFIFTCKFFLNFFDAKLCVCAHRFRYAQSEE